jgi:hypothetical protein
MSYLMILQVYNIGAGLPCLLSLKASTEALPSADLLYCFVSKQKIRFACSPQEVLP